MRNFVKRQPFTAKSENFTSMGLIQNSRQGKSVTSETKGLKKTMISFIRIFEDDLEHFE